jgi:hypothetical protein
MCEAWTLADADPQLIAQAWAWGFGTVLMCWLMGKGVGLVLSAIKRF